MNNDQIQHIALANGFKLKAQADGSMTLNPYVFEFAKALLAAAPTPPAQEDEPVAWRYKTVRGVWRYVGNRPRPYPYMPPEILLPEPLYTRPKSDNLRKAAEELIAEYSKNGWHRSYAVTIKMHKLGAALEGQS